MIIRAFSSATLLGAPTPAPAGVLGTFGTIDVLKLTSAELLETYGISLSPTDLDTPFELAAGLAARADRRTDARLRNDKLVRALARYPFLLPCFVGYQEAPGIGLLPFMTDGVPGRWSLFFEADGRMSLVECRGGTLAVAGHGELVDAERRLPNPLAKARWLLRGKLPAAAKSAARSPAE
jgi:hypothetical protein